MKTIPAFLMIIFFLLISIPAFSMQGSSDTKPTDFVKSNGKTQVNYNIHQVSVSDMNGKTHEGWVYDYVEIDGAVTEAKFKNALKKEDLEKKDIKEWTPDEAVTEFKYTETK